ncbi:hypothetical protein N7462_010618 [Penicillium macrosclerotiorum]|uniref:uncharacterized protein n=1 Tax=Penicillium macrosclerotiorum TaxID=303699 RepID=UPI0025488F5A|nr:uncharacterized protein N7462_010618 [Penicillium macrosclerotiorum]KAJ5669548.1 hypothetical protein N7462_010618 [Penicillium macrosclerotiorum]
MSVSLAIEALFSGTNELRRIAVAITTRQTCPFYAGLAQLGCASRLRRFGFRPSNAGEYIVPITISGAKADPLDAFPIGAVDPTPSSFSSRSNGTREAVTLNGRSLWKGHSTGLCDRALFSWRSLEPPPGPDWFW